MAPELGRYELTLNQLPEDVLAHDVTGDGPMTVKKPLSQ